MGILFLRRLRSLRWSAPLGITGLYFCIGTAWILLSDYVLALIATTPTAYAHLQTYKGAIYVAVTTFLIFGLLNTYAKAAADAITSLRQAENRLTVSLQHKEVLIRELHHRVRNNLQILTALLRLSGDHAPGKAFQRRVETLSAMQDALEPCANGEPVNLESILHESMKFVVAEAIRRNIVVTEEYDSCQIDPNTSVHIGLVISELATNAVEHGYPRNQGSGRVEVTAHHTENGLLLNVRDFGTGMPNLPGPGDTGNALKQMGPGLNISTALIEQDGGSWSFRRPDTGGTIVSILFPWDRISLHAASRHTK